MEMNLDQAIADLNQRIGKAGELMNQNSHAEAEQAIREAIQIFPARFRSVYPEYEWLRFESYRGISLFYLARYQEAISALEQACTAREQAGVIDGAYVQAMRFLALSYRQMCQFDRCLELHKKTSAMVKTITDKNFNQQEFIGNLEQDLSQMEAIRDNKPKFQLDFKPGGGQDVFNFDLVLPKEALEIMCLVTRLEVRPIDLYHLQIHLEFTLNNSQNIDTWPSTSNDHNLANRIPILFALLHPRYARVRHGSFKIDINDRDTVWKNQFFFLENQRYTIFHPLSYPRFGYQPMPICKSFQYLQSDCTLFRSRLSEYTSVRFEGIIDYPPPGDNTVTRGHNRSLFILLPCGQTFVSTTINDVLASPSGLEIEQMETQIVSFVEQRDSFEWNAISISGPPLSKPNVGRMLQLTNTDWKEGFSLKSMELLGVDMQLKAIKDISVSTKLVSPIIATGIYDTITYSENRDPSIASDKVTFSIVPKPVRVPLAICIAENYKDEERQLVFKTSCPELGIENISPITIGPKGHKTISIIPELPIPTPLFSDILLLQDKDLKVKKEVYVDITIEEKEPSKKTASRIIENRRELLQALPPDYMIWYVANNRDVNYIDLRHLIARWVTPDAPELQKFLREINLEMPSGDVTKDLNLIYDSLLSQGFTYDNAKLNFGYEMEHNYQRVRLPSVSLQHRHINCIDGTVLLASFMEKLEYEPIIAFIPHHAFFVVIQEGTLDSWKSLICIETTGLCAQSNRQALSFQEAAIVGRNQFAASQHNLLPKPPPPSVQRPDGTTAIEAYSAGDVDNMPGLLPKYRLVPISKARELDIQPFEITRE